MKPHYISVLSFLAQTANFLSLCGLCALGTCDIMSFDWTSHVLVYFSTLRSRAKVLPL